MNGYNFESYLAVYLAEVRKLHVLAEEYETRCSEYDAAVCTAKSPSGEPMPANGKELGLICRNARAVRESIIERENVSPNDLDNAIRNLPPKR